MVIIKGIIIKTKKKMKSKNLILMMLAMTLTTTGIYAQDHNETKTLFGNKKFSPFKKINTLGLYVAPEIQYAGLAGGYAPMGGISAMLQVNKKWGIGGIAYTTLEDYTPTKLSSTKAYNFDAQFGGLKLEFTPKPNSLVHVSFPLVIGAGMAKIDSVDANHNSKNDGDMYGEKGKNEGRKDNGNSENGKMGKEDNLFFMIQPGIHLETNILKYAKIFVGANYRIAAGKSGATSTNPLLIPTSSQMSGLLVNFGVKVGLFDYNIRRKKVTPNN
jgi:hypothetical protein